MSSTSMQFRVFVEPQQGASYSDQLAVAQASERLGFDAFFRSDHFVAMGGDGLPGPSDSWVTLGGIARETERIRLGTLVSSVTFRHPSLLAIQVAQVDQMSGGRVELGLGAGWFEREHAAYGFPFPAKRFGIFEEQLKIVTGLWGTPEGESFSFSGEHYTLVDSPALPKPVQSPSIPVIIGGRGATKTPALAAAFASDYNVGFVADGLHAPAIARVHEACEAIDRDPAELVYSAPFTIGVGETEAEARARAEKIGRDPAELRVNGLGGTVEQVAEHLERLRALGIQRVYLQLFDMSDIAQLELIASELVPRFA